MTSNRSTVLSKRTDDKNRPVPNPDAIADDNHSGHTFVRLGVPAEEFILGETLSALPDAEVECEQIVQCGNEVMPLLWVRGVDRSELEAAFVGDATVERASLVAKSGRELLYHVKWNSRIRVLSKILTNSDAVIRDAHGTSEGWSIHMLFSSRDRVSEAYATSEAFNIDVTVHAVYDMTESSGTMFGLTSMQREALEAAQKRGYFEVPRKVELDEVAEELGISHQSLSERLRRAHDVLIETTIRNGDCCDE